MPLRSRLHCRRQRCGIGTVTRLQLATSTGFGMTSWIPSRVCPGFPLVRRRVWMHLESGRHWLHALPCCWGAASEFPRCFLARTSGDEQVVQFGVPLLCSTPLCAIRRKFNSLYITVACCHCFVALSPLGIFWHCAQSLSPGFCVGFLSNSYVATWFSMPVVCIHLLPHSRPLPWNALRCASSAKVVGSDCGSLLPSVHWHSVGRHNAEHSPSPAHAPRTVCTFRAGEVPHPPWTSCCRVLPSRYRGVTGFSILCPRAYTHCWWQFCASAVRCSVACLLMLVSCECMFVGWKNYWQGYKLFCYVYYSHSLQHESQFRHSKLGSCIPYSHCFQAIVFLCFSHLFPSPLCLFLFHFGAASMLACRRTTSMAPSHPRACSFASHAARIMHAAPPPH